MTDQRVFFGVNGELETFSPPSEGLDDVILRSPGTRTRPSEGGHQGWRTGSGLVLVLLLRGGHEESVQGDGGGGHRWK